MFIIPQVHNSNWVCYNLICTITIPICLIKYTQTYYCWIPSKSLPKISNSTFSGGVRSNSLKAISDQKWFWLQFWKCLGREIWYDTFGPRAPIVLPFPHYLTRHCQKTEDETGGWKEGSHRGIVLGHKRGEIYVGKQLKTSSTSWQGPCWE